MLALLFALAWMNDRNGAYVVGGSQAIIRLIRERLDELGGHLGLGARVEKILVEQDAAVGVQLAGGEIIMAEWVISAADAHATIYDLLDGKYVDEITERTFRTLTPFASYLQVSFGVARDLSAQPGFVTRVLDAPLAVDPETTLSALSLRFFHFDPTFAPTGKTAVTCFLPTRNFAFWVDLQRNDSVRYQAEKHRVAEAVIAIVEKMVPDFRKAIETMDVSTPATVIRYTSNWQGSMEGWLLTPGMGFKPLRNTLPRLRRFLMAGQWVMPGGGLPSGLMTARLAVRTLCKEDRIPFLTDPAALSRAAEARRQAMHILIVDGHPDRNEQRFCHALAAAYAEGARQSGHDVRVIIIASINIPFLRSQDEWMHGTLPPQLREPQAAVKWADHLVIIYPLWLGDVPAYLKAFLEQIDRTSRSRRARRTQPQDH